MSGDKKRNPLFGITIRRFIEGKYAAGFKGDNRGPSLSFQVGYRTAASLFFDLKAGKQFMSTVGTTTGTTYVGYGLLDAITPDAFAIADVSTKGSMFIGNENVVYGRIRTSANDPLVPGSPDLDSVLTFKAVMTGGLLTISGQLQGDGFTGAEVIISYKDGREFLLTHKSEGTLISLGDKYLKDLGIFTKKYIVDKEGFIIEELSPLDPRYNDLSNTLFDKTDGPTIDVFLPPVTQGYQSNEVSPILHFNEHFWHNDEPTTVQVGLDNKIDAENDEPDEEGNIDNVIAKGDNQDNNFDEDPDEPKEDFDLDKGEGENDDTEDAENDTQDNDGDAVSDEPDEDGEVNNAEGENDNTEDAENDTQDNDGDAVSDEPDEDADEDNDTNDNQDNETDGDSDEPDEDADEDNDDDDAQDNEFDADSDEPDEDSEEDNDDDANNDETDGDSDEPPEEPPPPPEDPPEYFEAPPSS